MNVIEIKNLYLSHKNESDPFYSDLNLEIKQGKIVAIIGKSGAGKTTLFKALTRSMNNKQGSIKIFDQNIYEIGKKDWKKVIKKIGLLTQSNNLIYSQNVFENVKNGVVDYKNLFYSLFFILTKQQKIRIFELLDQLDILDKSFYSVSDLSGGQQQRVEIAKLLIKDVELILADEPTSNLDYKTSREVIDLLVSLSKEFGKTVLVNIHDLDLAIEKFDEIIVLNKGKIVLHDKVENIGLWKIKDIIKNYES